MSDISLEYAILKSKSSQDIDVCTEILLDSYLGTYFTSEQAHSLLKSAASQSQLTIALSFNDPKKVPVAFYVADPKGCFSVFPYLHLLAVKSSLRGQGLGTLLIKHFEKESLEAKGYPDRPKVFLLVTPHNPRALALYENLGYTREATFTDMFGEGDTEYLMMKDLGYKQHRSE
ncbi:MAG: GNAT family N-acetyltransferase [Spirochaetales bacterium]|nr:GNAT family N-acetyltransferase [Spirochaetales bacterium]